MNVLIVGVFDLFHRGHLEFLKKAKNYGENVYVLINGDEFTTQYKRKPIYSERDRAEIISALGFIYQVDITNSPDIKPYLEEHDINVILHGDDWEHESYLKQICVTQTYLDQRAIKVEYTSYYPHISTSAILDRVQERFYSEQV